jgi:hypothetical protein
LSTTGLTNQIYNFECISPELLKSEKIKHNKDLILQAKNEIEICRQRLKRVDDYSKNFDVEEVIELRKKITFLLKFINKYELEVHSDMIEDKYPNFQSPSSTRLILDNRVENTLENLLNDLIHEVEKLYSYDFITHEEKEHLKENIVRNDFIKFYITFLNFVEMKNHLIMFEPNMIEKINLIKNKIQYIVELNSD